MCAKILIVDDNTDMQKLLSDLLASEKHHVELASIAEEALENMKEDTFDLIISDICMPPGMDGIELLEKIRKMDIDSEVIFITAYGSVNNAVEAMRSGAVNYIEKPLDFGRLKSLALHVLKERFIQRSFAEDKLLSYTLSCAVFDTEELPADKREDVLQA